MQPWRLSIFGFFTFPEGFLLEGGGGGGGGGAQHVGSQAGAHMLGQP